MSCLTIDVGASSGRHILREEKKDKLKWPKSYEKMQYGMIYDTIYELRPGSNMLDKESGYIMVEKRQVFINNILENRRCTTYGNFLFDANADA